MPDRLVLVTVFEILTLRRAGTMIPKFMSALTVRISPAFDCRPSLRRVIWMAGIPTLFSLLFIGYNADRWEPGPSTTRDSSFRDGNVTENRSREVFDAPRWPARDRDRNLGSGQDTVLPSGPRIKSRESFGDSVGYQGAPSFGRQPPARPVAYSQPSLPRRETDGRRLDDGRTRRVSVERERDAMDVDVPTGPRNDKVTEAAYGRSGMYNDRYTGGASREKEDALPTGPRAMNSRTTAPPSPVVSTPNSSWRQQNAPAIAPSSSMS